MWWFRSLHWPCHSVHLSIPSLGGGPLITCAVPCGNGFFFATCLFDLSMEIIRLEPPSGWDADWCWFPFSQCWHRSCHPCSLWRSDKCPGSQAVSARADSACHLGNRKHDDKFWWFTMIYLWNRVIVSYFFIATLNNQRDPEGMSFLVSIKAPPKVDQFDQSQFRWRDTDNTCRHLPTLAHVMPLVFGCSR